MTDTNISMTSANGIKIKSAGKYVENDIVVTPDATSKANLIPENIKENVAILGVTGTYLGKDGLSVYTTTSVLVSSGSSTIAQTAINIPEGRTLQVGDLIQDRFGVVGRVTAVGATVSYTFYADLKGETGADGTDGTDGKDGLSIYPTTSNLVKSGTGSIPVANITMPEFRTIQIGDLLLDPTGVIGQATSGGTTNINYIFFEDIHGEDGTDGQDGAQGPAGRAALTCNGFNIDTSGEAPEVGQTYTMGIATLNQTPVIGDKFMTVFNTATDVYPDGGSYLCGCHVTAVNGDQGTIEATFTFSIQTVNSITGQRGPAGQGVPTGGTTGQVLKKASNTPYDTVWADESGGIDSTTGGDTNFSTVSNIVTTTADSPDASSLPEGTLVIKIAS